MANKKVLVIKNDGEIDVVYVIEKAKYVHAKTESSSGIYGDVNLLIHEVLIDGVIYHYSLWDSNMPKLEIQKAILKKPIKKTI
ncbi:hypothetical protein O1V64_10925 [Rouxiella badensis]|nr:hypothetical protein O1V64_10925 [Rouxiella badensis]